MNDLAARALEAASRDKSGDPPEQDDVRLLRASRDDPNSQRALDRRLDQALQDTFPASDPVSIVVCV